MRKSEQILALWNKVPDGPSKTRIIADKVGCLPEYVRVVARQRKDRGKSEADRRYLIKRYGSLKAYENEHNATRAPYRNAYYAKRRELPEYREYKSAMSSAWRKRKRLEQAAGAPA